MKNLLMTLFLILMSGCAGSADDYATSGGRSPILADTYLDANGEDLNDNSDSNPEPGSTGNGSNDDDSVNSVDDATESTSDTDLCLNANDLAILNSDDPSFEDVMNSCFETCITDDTENCFRDCLTSTTDLSESCAQCHDTLMMCYMNTCFAACSSEDSETNCEICLADNCYAPYVTCSGVDPEE